MGWIEPFEPGRKETVTERLARRQRAREQARERERQEAAELERRKAYAVSIWSKAGDPAGTPVEIYLSSRGIDVSNSRQLPPSIRYGYVKEPGTGQHLPAMVCAVCHRPDTAPNGVHVTYLTPQGRKAPVSAQKRMYGPCKGGAVRLGAPDDVLALAEGVESALSFMQLTSMPTWATLGPSGLRSVVVPDEVERAVLAADHDGPSVAAARD